MSEFMIHHQMQPCPVSCVSTCIAMLTGKPVAEIIERFHANYREGDLSIGDMLRELNLDFKDFRSAERQSIDRDAIYLCSVPSLNIQGGMHEIVVEMANDGDWVVHDPNMGRDDRLYYTSRPGDDSKAVMMSSGYTVDAVVDHDTLDAWHKFWVRG